MAFVRTERSIGRAPLVRWAAVFSGTIVGLALTLLVGSLWTALAFASHESVFYTHLAWWLAGTAIGATFVAAWIAAAVSGSPGKLAGIANGLTTWGLIVLGGVAAGVPSLASYGTTRPIVVNGIRVGVATVRPWTTFWALLIGLGIAIVGGFLGGLSQRQRPIETEVDIREMPAAKMPEPVSATR